MSEKLQVAVAGIGRMGMRHARHFATLTPRAELIAVCSPVQAELDAAKKEFGVRTYLSFDDMLANEKTLQAVVVASATTVHAEQAIKAIERGYHVLCEKPLSTSPEIVNLFISFSSMRYSIGHGANSSSLKPLSTLTAPPSNPTPSRK